MTMRGPHGSNCLRILIVHDLMRLMRGSVTRVNMKETVYTLPHH